MIMNTIKKYFFLASSAMMMFSCETGINPTLEIAEPVYGVDAWINNKPEAQVIVLTKSQPYFDNTLPSGISGATVKVTDEKGFVYTFLEDNAKRGTYVWTPNSNEAFGKIGFSYQLDIQVGGETLKATSKMGRVPVIDSVTYYTEKRLGTEDVVTFGQFWATDPAGPHDSYWIRTYKNGALLGKPSEINIAYDAGASSGGLTDGVTFIQPIRQGINSSDKDTSEKRMNPIASGDSLNVQIHSITLSAFDHLYGVKIQTDRPGGFAELFATPLANVSTNIINANEKGTKTQGFFNVAAVSSSGKRFKD